ncbi:MAG: site-specific integrase, partial [Pseudomonadales bacterium]|nr:site-specific integrase [Pseudomonadales bacterium]
EIRKRSGPYPWRHTYISLNLVSGVSINDVAQQVGNSPLIIEKHYSKWIPTQDDTKRLRAQLEGALS